MERVEDRPAVDALDRDAVGVLGRVHRRVEGTQHEERRGQQPPRRREASRDEQQPVDHARDDGEPAAPEAVDEDAGESAREQPADRHRGDRRPELRVGQVEPGLDRGQAREHVGDERAVHEEQHADAHSGTNGQAGRTGDRRHRTGTVAAMGLIRLESLTEVIRAGDRPV